MDGNGQESMTCLTLHYHNPKGVFRPGMTHCKLYALFPGQRSDRRGSETNSSLVRPIILTVYHGSGVLVENIKMINSPEWFNLVSSYPYLTVMTTGSIHLW